MLVTRVSLRDFRCYTSADVAIGPGLTIVHGRNGAGKTNLLEAIYLGCTARSCRTANDRELVRFGERVTRVELAARDDAGEHVISVGLEPGERRQVHADGVAVDRLLDVATRPLACVFLPDRLELVKGAPSLRRGHIDQVVAALWPARAETRRAYGRALAQRNALLPRIRAGRAAADSLRAWDAELARHGVALIADRGRATDELAPRFAALASELGLGPDALLAYRPRSRATTADELAGELAERTDGDVERGFTGHGPHRDDLVLTHNGRELRVYGSQGQQRLALLSLLLAEVAAIAATRGFAPLMLLDDVMSELDPDRRERLVALLAAGGQSVITTTDLDHVPATGAIEVTRVAVSDGAILQEAAAA